MAEEPQLRRLHIAAVILSTLRVVRGWLIPLVLSFAVKTEAAPTPWYFWVALGGAALTTLNSIVHDLSLRYGIVENRLHIRSGVLVRQNRQIPLERIQTIDLQQGPMHRLLGVAEVRIETAGGKGESEAHLAAVGFAEAQRFQATLLGRRTEQQRSETPELPRLVRKSSLRELLIAGATTNRIGLIVASLFGLFEFSSDVGESSMEPLFQGVHNLAAASPLAQVALAAAGIIGIVLSGWVVSVALTVVKFYGFTLFWAGHDLKRRHGLLTRYEGTIPLDRLQLLRLNRPLLRRFLGLLSVQAATAGSAKDHEGGDVPTLCPLLRESEVAPFCRVLLPDLFLEWVRFSPVHPRCQSRTFVRLELLGALVLLLLSSDRLQTAAILWLAWTPLAFFLSRVRYRVIGHARVGPYFICQSGVLNRRTWIVPKSKIQSIAIHRSPMQRRLGLASLEIATAGASQAGRVTLPDLGVPEAIELFESLSAESAQSASRREAL